MVAFDYAKMRTTAERLIARFGRSAELRRAKAHGPAYDPTIGPDDYCPVTVVLGEYAVKEIDGTLIKAEDRKVTMSTEGVTITPETSDRLLIGSTLYDIVTIKPLEPGGTVLLWKMQVRRT